MDMHVFQVESNKVLPQQGSILISSPFMNDYHFTRAVVLLIEHNDEGSMGIIMNKDFRYHILLNDLIPELEFAQRVPVYKGGPVSRETIFFLHTLKDLEGALPLGNGLYLNGDFNAVQQYILDGKPFLRIHAFRIRIPVRDILGKIREPEFHIPLRRKYSPVLSGQPAADISGIFPFSGQRAIIQTA